MIALAGCTVIADRAPCDRDVDCEEGEICWMDGYCAPKHVLERRGWTLASECSVEHTIEQGCRPNEVCRAGLCEMRDASPADAQHTELDEGAP